LGKQKHNVQKPTDIPLQRGPNFNTARRHFELYLAAWLLVHDIKMYNKTSGRVTWTLKNEHKQTLKRKAKEEHQLDSTPEAGDENSDKPETGKLHIVIAFRDQKQVTQFL